MQNLFIKIGKTAAAVVTKKCKNKLLCSRNIYWVPTMCQHYTGSWNAKINNTGPCAATHLVGPTNGQMNNPNMMG